MIFYLLIFSLFVVAFSLYGFWVATHPPRYTTNKVPQDLGWEYEEVSLTTSDGVKLAAWLVPPSKPSDKVIIQLHGYPADKADILYWSSFLHEDFNLFFLDFRYFGKSEGKLTTIGGQEVLDLKAAINYLEDKGFTKIGVMGFSLGGAVAILTAAKDARINAVVSDSAYANLDLMGHEFYRNLFILKYPLTALTKFWAQSFLGINANEIAPENAAKNLKIPILIIHSKTDQTISFENAQRLQKALKDNPKTQFLFLEEGTHGALPQNLIDEYQSKVINFLKENLK